MRRGNVVEKRSYDGGQTRFKESKRTKIVVKGEEGDIRIEKKQGEEAES